VRDRGELAASLYCAERVSPTRAALAVLLGLNGLRVSEACGANVEDLGIERGHRTPRVVGKGNQPATVPLVPRTARAVDLAVGERATGPILVRRDGGRLDPRTAHRWVRSIGHRVGLDHVHPHMLRAAFIMAALDAGVPLRDMQLAARHADPRTTTIYDRRRQNLDRHAAYAVVAFVPTADDRPSAQNEDRPRKGPTTSRRAPNIGFGDSAREASLTVRAERQFGGFPCALGRSDGLSRLLDCGGNRRYVPHDEELECSGAVDSQPRSQGMASRLVV